MNYNCAIPLRDELALGFLGRFSRLNGMKSISRFTKSIHENFQRNKREPMLWLLARACNQDIPSFTAKHSMLPVIYPVLRGDQFAQETLWTQQHIQLGGMGTPSKVLRWCQECAQLDEKERGFSYWKRSHQIIGIDGCSIHHVPLMSVDLGSAIFSPGQTNSPRLVNISESDLVNEFNNAALQRFQQIMCGRLQGGGPVSLEAWNVVVSRRCQTLGLRVCEIGKRPIATDLIFEQFPQSWLKRHMPEIANKTPSTCLRKFDGACFDKHIVYPVLACTAILSILYESAEHALAELDSVNAALLRKDYGQATEQAFSAFISGEELHEACSRFGVRILDVLDELRSRYIQLAYS